MQKAIKRPEGTIVLKIEGRKFFANPLSIDQRKIFNILKEVDPDLALKFVYMVGKLVSPLDRDYINPRQ